MRAVQITELSGPGAVAVQEVAEPSPTDGQVLVEVHRAGVVYPDVLLSRGEYQVKPELPFVPGSEIAGTVLQAPDGSDLRTGDRVAGAAMLGAFAEQVALPPELVLPLPDEMDLDTAAALPMNYLTCLFGLEHRGGLRAGETVLVHGASGGIGTAAIQIASAIGARVIAVVSDESRAGVAQAAGADEVIDVDGFKDRAKELTDGRGVDLVVDPVGGDRFTDSLRSLATEGRLLVIGFTGGSIPEVKVNRLLLNNISVVGVGWGAYWMPRPEYLRQQWARLLELWRGGRIAPPVGGRYSLEDAATAITALDERAASGKLLLTLRD